MIKVIPASSKDDCIAIQEVFNHKDIIAYLGGFTMKDSLIGKLKGSGTTLWKALVDDKIVGGFETAGRPQCHVAKFGQVGVLPDYRRQRVATCLYVACMCQCILEGRRLIEDTIVSDNEIQQLALPKLLIEKVGTLKQKTASFKDIALYQFWVTTESVEYVLDRLPLGSRIEIVRDSYTEDLWKKNETVYLKHKPSFVDVISTCRMLVEQNPHVIITKVDKSSSQKARRSTFI